MAPIMTEQRFYSRNTATNKRYMSKIHTEHVVANQLNDEYRLCVHALSLCCIFLSVVRTYYLYQIKNLNLGTA